MKFSDVIIQIATEMPNQIDEALIKQLRVFAASHTEADKILTQAQADSLIEAARKDPGGFIAWLHRNYSIVMDRLGHA